MEVEVSRSRYSNPRWGGGFVRCILNVRQIKFNRLAIFVLLCGMLWINPGLSARAPEDLAVWFWVGWVLFGSAVYFSSASPGPAIIWCLVICFQSVPFPELFSFRALHSPTSDGPDVAIPQESFPLTNMRYVAATLACLAFFLQILHFPAPVRTLDSPTSEGPDVAIPQQRKALINIWNVAALKETLMGMRDRFQRQVPPYEHDSYSRSPPRYEHDSGCTSAKHENNDERLQPIPFGILHYECVNFIDSRSLAWLDGVICQLQSVEPGNPQILEQVFAENSAMLDSYLYDHFTSAGLYIDKWTSCTDASEFTYQSANDCVMILTISARLLRLMHDNLAEADCKSFGQDLRDHYFDLCARRLRENLIKAADSISNLKWRGSHIYQMLVLYKAIADVLYDLKDPPEKSRILQQMQGNFKGIFDGIKCIIHKYLNDQQHTIVQVERPVKLTDFLVKSMELFNSHSSTVQDTCIDNSSSSLDHYLYDVIRYLEEQLGGHKSFIEDRKRILLLNILTHIDEETTKSSDALKLLITTHIENYLKQCWGPIRELISGGQPNRSSLIAFTSQFNIVYQCQKMWVLQTQLKRKLRKEIEDFLVPCYDTLLKKLQNRPFWKFRFFFRKHNAGQQAKYMTTEELRSKVQGMFEAEHNE